MSTQVPRPAAPAPRKRPDPRPLRVAFGLTGLATTSALLSAFLAPFAGADAGTQSPAAVTDQGAADGAAGGVRHVTRYVQLAPGQTAPPNTAVQQPPKPKPRTVVVRTRQSGG